VKAAIYTLLMSMLMMSTAMAATAAAKPRAADGKASKATPVQAPKGNALLGKDKSDAERCQECHGAQGQGQGHPNGPEGKFPKLAGQHVDYLLKQIADFRSGARKDDQMAIMARSVTDEDVLDILTYFNAQSPMKGEGGDAQALGKKLYTQGDPARGITACVSCHGELGKGVAATPLVPIIGGQEWRYLEKQLLDWRTGDRRNSEGSVMNQVTKGLTDAELQALANYLSGL
jgi:cytochrome c553